MNPLSRAKVADAGERHMKNRRMDESQINSRVNAQQMLVDQELQQDVPNL